MRRQIAAKHLQPGFVLPGALLLHSGKVLLKPGTRLGPDQLVQVTQYVHEGLYGDSKWPDALLVSANTPVAPSPGGGKNISVESLKTGMRLTEDLYDAESEVLLLAAGFQVTPRFLRLLGSRGIKIICAKPRENRVPTSDQDTGVTTVAEAQARALDALLEDELKKRIPFRELSSTERPRLALDDLKAEANEGLELHLGTSGVVADVCENVRRGRDVAGANINAALDGFVRRALMDVDLLPMIVSLHNTSDEYLFDHCVNVALLSMSMAAQAGLSLDKILEVGFGALLQDIGMLRVSEEIRLSSGALNADQRAEVDRHPLYSIEMLSNVNLAPLTASIIMYQSHERVDGTGFPRRQVETKIHPFARIVGIADTFAAMTAERPYRPAWRPYEASKHILTNLGRYDRATARLFLDTVGLFPIGSVVELCTGCLGKVTRVVPGSHTRPVIELIDANGRPTGRLVNMAVELDIKVVRAFHRVKPRMTFSPTGSSSVSTL